MTLYKIHASLELLVDLGDDIDADEIENIVNKEIRNSIFYGSPIVRGTPLSTITEKEEFTPSIEDTEVEGEQAGPSICL